MSLRNLIPALTAAVIFATFATVSAQPCPYQGKGEGKGPHHRMFADLELNKEQTDNLQKLHEEMQVSREKHLEAVKSVRDKIKSELLKKVPTQKTLYGYAEELGKLHTQMSKDQGDHLLKIKKVLTAEQFSQLIEKQDKEKCGRYFKGKRGKGCENKSAGCPHNRGKCMKEGNGCPRNGGPKGCCPHTKGDSTKATEEAPPAK